MAEERDFERRINPSPPLIDALMEDCGNIPQIHVSKNVVKKKKKVRSRSRVNSDDSEYEEPKMIEIKSDSEAEEEEIIENKIIYQEIENKQIDLKERFDILDENVSSPPSSRKATKGSKDTRSRSISFELERDKNTPNNRVKVTSLQCEQTKCNCWYLPTQSTRYCHFMMDLSLNLETKFQCKRLWGQERKFNLTHYITSDLLIYREYLHRTVYSIKNREFVNLDLKSIINLIRGKIIALEITDCLCIITSGNILKQPLVMATIKDFPHGIALWNNNHYNMETLFGREVEIAFLDCVLIRLNLFNQKLKQYLYTLVWTPIYK